MHTVNDYNLVNSVTPEEFNKLTSEEGDIKYNVANDEEIKKMERLLDVEPGTLAAAGPFKLEDVQCTSCGRTLTMYDFIFTALVDANHTKSLVLHTFVGSKFVVQRPRPVRCSACGTMGVLAHKYLMRKYTCTVPHLDLK
jgi:DNA-directed RNA polymerase subunit N (RpoN/RPB10)